MRRLNVLLACMMILSLFVAVDLTSAQGGDNPLPADAGDAYILFPDVLVDGVISEGALQQRYVLMANAGNIMSVTANMSEPGLIARLELYDASGVVLAEQVPDAAAPDAVLLSYEVMTPGWYFVNVSLAAAPTATSAYTLALTGTTRSVYDVFAASAPPAVPGAHLVPGTMQLSGMLEAAVPFLIPVDAGDVVTVTAEGASQPRLRITAFEDGTPAQTLIAEAPQAGAAVTYNHVAAMAQWVRIDVEPAQAGEFTLDVIHPTVSSMAADVVGEGGVSTASAGGATGELCGGIPARFAVGDVIVVSQEGDNLQLMTEYTGGSAQTIALAIVGNQFEVLDPPVCYSSPGYNQDIWFWYVYSYAHDANGWIADGLADERWVCGAEDPACNQAAECATEPAALNVGDLAVVSQTGDNLQIMRFPGATDQVLALASWNDQFEVLGGPTCYYSAWHGGGLWYWNVYSQTDEIAGWVVEGVDDEVWVCPASNPTCDK